MFKVIVRESQTKNVEIGICATGRFCFCIIGRLRFHYDNDNEYENEIFVCWRWQYN